MATTVEEESEKEPSADERGPEEGRPAGPTRGLLREYAESAAVVLVMAVFFMTFVAQAAEVPSASMENTVYVGDRFLINKFIFGPGPSLPFLPQREIRRGDIVVFKYPAESVPSESIVQYKTLFIKRVIALPGETIEVRGADILVDGKLLPEHRVRALDRNLGNDKAELKRLESAPRKGDEPYTVYYSPAPNESGFVNAIRRPFRVPEGHYFMMGDNRDNSKDSRFWGTVPRELVVGRAMFVIWSYDESARRAPGGLGFVSDFFNNTRWGRIGTLLR
ncbi:MAG TPA: signal peptidase I [Pyrinomonadaceae bacterium]